ncbi:MAG: hypothetical protein KDA37_11615, partial [Planctomycetales bacterium]|nr:hypothetical protein [Planctomycetales bacterium]
GSGAPPFRPRPPSTPYGPSTVGGRYATGTIANDFPGSIRVLFQVPGLLSSPSTTINAGDAPYAFREPIGTTLIIKGYGFRRPIKLTNSTPVAITVTRTGEVVEDIATAPRPVSSGLKIDNLSDDWVAVRFGGRNLRIPRQQIEELTTLKPGRRVQVSTLSKTATFIYSGNDETVLVLPSGDFENLPRTAVVTASAPDTFTEDDDPLLPGNTLPGDPGGTGPEIVDAGNEKAPANTLPSNTPAPLRSSTVARFKRRVTEQSRALLTALDRGSLNRLNAMGDELSDLGVDASSRSSILSAARQGKTDRVEELLDELPEDLKGYLQASSAQLRSVAEFRSQLAPLSRLASAGSLSDKAQPYLTAISAQASALGDDGLATAMGRIKSDLMIYGELSRSLKDTKGSLSSLPRGAKVTVVKHPLITEGHTYFSPTLVLMGSGESDVLVAKTTAAAALGLPVGDKEHAAPDSVGSLASELVLLSNPEKNRGSITFLLDKKRTTLKSGQRMLLPADNTYNLRFLSKTGGEAKEYNLGRPGIFPFVVRSGGWDLSSRRQITVTLSNVTDTAELEYLCNGDPQTLEPGEFREHDSTAAIRISFDRGDGRKTLTKVLDTKGDYYFGINADTRYWDLFPGAPPSTIDDDANVFPIERPSVSVLQQLVGQTLFKFDDSDIASDDDGDGDGDSGGDLFNKLRGSVD